MFIIILHSGEKAEAMAWLLSLCCVVAKGPSLKEVSIPNVVLGLICARTTCSFAITAVPGYEMLTRARHAAWPKGGDAELSP